MTLLTTPIENAAYMLLEDGLTFDEVDSILKWLHQPSSGWVYLSDIGDLIIGRFRDSSAFK